jgi:hypothetical protein
LAPGTYINQLVVPIKSLNGDLTLDAQGNPNAVDIQAESSLTVGSPASRSVKRVELTKCLLVCR